MAVSAEDRAVLVSTRLLLARVREQTGLAYADDTWSPISDITLDILARQMGGMILHDELGANTQEIGVPGYFGPPAIVVNRMIPSGFRRLALRHGLAHLAAGELDAGQESEVRFMSSILDYDTLEERRADLFALADLIPDRQVDEFLLAGGHVRDLPGWVARQTRSFAPDWPIRRVRDRARLRAELYGDRRD